MCRLRVATRYGVSPSLRFTALFALHLSSSTTHSADPHAAASCSGALPCASWISGFAPISSRNCVIIWLPSPHAMCSGVCPSPSRIFTDAPLPISSTAQSVCEYRAAMCSGESPFLSSAFRSAPFSISTCAHFTLPFATAICSGVEPLPSRWFTSAPWRSSMRSSSTLPRITTWWIFASNAAHARCFFAIASINGVRPLYPRISLVAPALSSSFTPFTEPTTAARCSAVSPWKSVASTAAPAVIRYLATSIFWFQHAIASAARPFLSWSASETPFSNRNFTPSRRPNVLATCIGVEPVRSFIVSSAPWRCSACAISMWPKCIAICIAVFPLRSRAFTSQPSAIIASSITKSFRRTAVNTLSGASSSAHPMCSFSYAISYGV
eukprot:comp21812_c0_seq1/m.49084 comp21812_c0_seq1/g.49084  ORF comp21812_c0_seq1/g.49084 comp21812_c0_seq1/m.49084 type:complete len:381 (+) comp21812_c0_seq1:527-1669(+)